MSGPSSRGRPPLPPPVNVSLPTVAPVANASSSNNSSGSGAGTNTPGGATSPTTGLPKTRTGSLHSIPNKYRTGPNVNISKKIVPKKTTAAAGVTPGSNTPTFRPMTSPAMRGMTSPALRPLASPVFRALAPSTVAAITGSAAQSPAFRAAPSPVITPLVMTAQPNQQVLTGISTLSLPASAKPPALTADTGTPTSTATIASTLNSISAPPTNAHSVTSAVLNRGDASVSGGNASVVGVSTPIPSSASSPSTTFDVGVGIGSLPLPPSVGTVSSSSAPGSLWGMTPSPSALPFPAIPQLPSAPLGSGNLAAAAQVKAAIAAAQAEQNSRIASLIASGATIASESGGDAPSAEQARTSKRKRGKKAKAAPSTANPQVPADASTVATAPAASASTSSSAPLNSTNAAVKDVEQDEESDEDEDEDEDDAEGDDGSGAPKVKRRKKSQQDPRERTLKDIILDNVSGAPSKSTVEKQTKRRALHSALKRKAALEASGATVDENAAIALADRQLIEQHEADKAAKKKAAEQAKMRKKRGLIGFVPKSKSSQDVFTRDQPEDDGAPQVPPPAPRVEVKDGKMVVVESSLIVEAPKSQPVELDVVYETQSKVTSASYSNRQSVDRWSMKDTQLLYKALSQYGTDFQLIAQLFPKRNRKQIKAKFKKEEKHNTRLIEQALKTRLPIDVAEFDRAMARTAAEHEIDVERELAEEDAAAAAAPSSSSSVTDVAATPAPTVPAKRNGGRSKKGKPASTDD